MLAALVRHRVVTLAVLAVLVVGAAILSEVVRPDDDGGAIAVRGTLGPTPGPDAEGYIATKRALLARLAGDEPDTPAAGLVSLSRFATGEEAAALVAGAPVGVLFVRAPEGSPEVLAVEGTLGTTVGVWAKRQAAALEADAGQAEALAETAAQADRDRYLQEASAKRAAAGALIRGCACVYALVVNDSTVGTLHALAAEAAVRLVDVPDPPVADLGGWQLTPILPQAPS